MYICEKRIPLILDEHINSKCLECATEEDLENTPDKVELDGLLSGKQDILTSDSLIEALHYTDIPLELNLCDGTTAEYTLIGDEVTYHEDSGQPLLFSSDHALPVQKLLVEIVPSQTGTPSPDNVCPITRYLTVEIDANGNVTSVTIPDDPVATDFMFFGGTLDVLTGELTITRAGKVLDGTESWARIGSPTYRFYTGFNIQTVATPSDDTRGCSHFPNKDVVGTTDNGFYAYNYTSSVMNIVIRYYPNYTTVTNWKNYLAAQYANGTPVTCWWELDPSYYETVQLTPKQIGTIIGTNNISANSGAVTVGWLD